MDCICVEPSKLQEKLITLGGKEYWNNYPKQWIPDKTNFDMVYIWVFDNAKEWETPKEVGRGMNWVNVNFEDI